VKRIRGGAPLRRIFSRRMTLDARDRERCVMKLHCGHEIERAWKTAPKVSIGCEECLAIEDAKADAILAELGDGRPLYELAFRLGGLPSGQQSTGRNRFAIAAERKRWHRAVWFQVRPKLPPVPLRLVEAVYTRHSSVGIDPTNLAWSFKAIEDGLVECGVLRDDGPENYLDGRPDYRWEAAPPRGGFVTIHITEHRREQRGEEEDHSEEGRSEEGLDHTVRLGEREERLV
jgi:hypothetical protein